MINGSLLILACDCSCCKFCAGFNINLTPVMLDLARTATSSLAKKRSGSERCDCYTYMWVARTVLTGQTGNCLGEIPSPYIYNGIIFPSLNPAKIFQFNSR